MLALGVHLIRVITFSVRSHYSNLLREDVLVPLSFIWTRGRRKKRASNIRETLTVGGRRKEERREEEK